MPATTHFKKANIINLLVELNEIEDWIIETCDKKINKNKVRKLKICLNDKEIAIFEKTNENNYIFQGIKKVPKNYKP